LEPADEIFIFNFFGENAMTRRIDRSRTDKRCVSCYRPPVMIDPHAVIGCRYGKAIPGETATGMI